MEIILAKGQQGKDIASLRSTLAKTIGDDAGQYAGLAKGNVFDDLTEAAVRHWQSGIGIVADGIVGPYCQALLNLVVHPELELPLTVDFVNSLFPGAKASTVQRHLPYVAAALRAVGLLDKPMILAALGTIRAETDGFAPIAEFPSQYNTRPGMPPFSSYDGRLGNKQPGDGYRYRGRGFVQLTGLTNYQTYGAKINVDIVNSPDLANAPEVAAVLLATFLDAHKGPMQAALAEGNYLKARKLVNGGSHGLDRFKSVFDAAAAKAPVASATKRTAATKAAAPKSPAKKPIAAKRDTAKDPVDLRDRLYTPPPASLPDAYPNPADIGKYLGVYAKAKLILDQGSEGACTGFGLACVVNYLRWRKSGTPTKLASVSPRMLYNYARRYDEYAGEEYEGSSCRGALKGWFYHGVCLEEDWPYKEADVCPPNFGYAKRATANTLGIYYRIDTKIISDLQAAIHEVGAIYVSAFTHDGWAVPAVSKRAIGHDTLPFIEFDGIPSQSAGHAFALVGFNTRGFIVQNSWGSGWGHGGFAILSYADWLANGMDAWVAALGVPGVMQGQLAMPGGVAGAGVAGAAAGAGWWDKATAYEHSVVLGDNGRVNNYLTEDELARTLQYQACGLPDKWFRTQPAAGKKRLVLFAHGGLNSEEAAITRARALGRYFTGNGCYPLFMVWKTGLLESVRNIIAGTMSREPALAGGIGEAFTDASDLLLESTVGRPLVKPIWSEMKENAAFASQPTRGGDLLVTALQNLASTWGDELEIHLVGHSAGAIFLGHFVDLLAARALEQRIASLHLYAPACTVQFANRHFAPQQELMKRLFLDVLTDENERGDNVAAVYRKSLLYFVSNSLENDARTPLLGLENIAKSDYQRWDGSSTSAEALKKWRQAVADAGLLGRGQIKLLEARKVRTSISGTEINASHGCFDNAIDIVERTLLRITGAEQLQMPVVDLRGF
jgi:peptidoglycan hydrolase-like protein with peptidoglycan-binding domain